MSFDQGDIEVPRIYISEGWYADELETIDDCEDAFAYLMSAVAEIEYQLEIVGRDRARENRLRRVLKYRRAALQIVNNRRGRITKKEKDAQQKAADRVLLDVLRENIPREDFDRCVAIAQARSA